MNRVVFRDTSTALRVSYTVKALPVAQRSSMRQTLICMMEGARLVNMRQLEWYGRLIGHRSDLVDFSGLNDLDRRAQCVMICEAVKHRLEEPEACAVIARFAMTQAEKEAGIVGLATHLCGRASPPRDHAVMHALCMRRYAPLKAYGDGYSLRDISKRTRVSKSQLYRLAQRVNEQCSELEVTALKRLEKIFVPQGVCDYEVPIFRLEQA